jgi:glycosyltransferase involved in cell wall biosynthesis
MPSVLTRSTDSMRILVVAANASTGWAGEAILPLHIFRGLRKTGHEAWMCVGRETKPELDDLLGPDAGRVIYVEDTRIHAVFRRLQAIMPHGLGFNPLYYAQVLATQFRQRAIVPRLIEKLDIAVVHQPTPISSRLPSLLGRLPAPLVIGPMNGAMEYPPGFRFLQQRSFRSVKNVTRGLSNLLPRFVDAKRRAECLIVANKRTEDGLPSGVRGQIFRMVENGIIPEIWERDALEDGKAASESRPFEVIFIGRLERWKGPEWAIDAVARASERVDCRLKVIGELGEERRRLTARVEELGIKSRVEFLGWLSQDRCAEMLNKADVMVLPSVFDPGATVVLEAMAAGKPVIAAKWGGPHDILDPSCGILVEPRDPASLVEGIEQAIISLANDRERCACMGRAGRAKVLAEYTWPMKIERFIEIYREAIKARSMDRHAASKWGCRASRSQRL